MSSGRVEGGSPNDVANRLKTNRPPPPPQFISDLMLQPPVALADPYSGRTHRVHPARLASGILTAREELAAHVAKGLPSAVARSNVSVLRRHLEEHTYVSGTHVDAPRPSYRDYRRRGSGSRWQRLASSS
jgi:hypothetical protein